MTRFNPRAKLYLYIIFISWRVFKYNNVDNTFCHWFLSLYEIAWRNIEDPHQDNESKLIYRQIEIVEYTREVRNQIKPTLQIDLSILDLRSHQGFQQALQV